MFPNDVCTRTRDVKKQINHSVKAHLLRSALILLSLVAFNRDIFCQTPTPTATATDATMLRPPPGECASYEAESDVNTLQGSAIVLSCPTCSGGLKVGYVGSNNGTLQFNAVGIIASGNYTMTICYLNGDAVRYATLSVNGGPGTPLSFPSTGGFQTLGSIQITVTLNTGCNTLEFNNPIVGSWAPDFDRIQFNCPTCALPTPTPTAIRIHRRHYTDANVNAYRTATPTPTPTSPTPNAYAHYHADAHSDADADAGGVLSQFHHSGRLRCASVSHYRFWKYRTRLALALCQYHRQL